MKTLYANAESDFGADPSIGRQLANDDAIAVSEKAKRQIGAQASVRKANLAGKFSDGGGGFLET